MRRTVGNKAGWPDWVLKGEEDALERQHNFSSTSGPQGGTEAKESFECFMSLLCPTQTSFPVMEDGRKPRTTQARIFMAVVIYQPDFVSLPTGFFNKGVFNKRLRTVFED